MFTPNSLEGVLANRSAGDWASKMKPPMGAGQVAPTQKPIFDEEFATQQAKLPAISSELPQSDFPTTWGEAPMAQQEPYNLQQILEMLNGGGLDQMMSGIGSKPQMQPENVAGLAGTLAGRMG